VQTMLYPSLSGGPPGESAVCGPDGGGGGLCWTIRGQPGDTYEVVLDWTQESERAVSWSKVSAAPEAIMDHDAAEVEVQEESPQVEAADETA